MTAAPRVPRRWLELGGLAAILVLAALLRLPGLDQRGPWDSDQGRDMSVLHSMVSGGAIPLLGPSTSIGGLHHGALYDYLLAPVAALSNSDPVAVMVAIALAGVAAVAAVAWLGRLLGGPVSGLVAGLLAAVSPSLIESSVTIWEPSLIPLASAVGLAGSIEARRTGLARWWLVAGLGVGVALQLHVLDVLLLVPLAWAFIDDIRRRRAAGKPMRTVIRGGAGAVLIILLGYLPLAIHELTSDFSEVRALLAYLGGAGGGGGAHAGILERLVMVVMRTLTWPVAGLVTDRPAASLAAMALVVVLGAAALLLPWRRRRAGASAPDDGVSVGNDDRTSAPLNSAAPDRWPIAWLLGTLAFSAVALAVLAPSLAVVTPGLPNDHYHAFLDPVVLALVGTGTARLAQATLGPAIGQRASSTRLLEPAAAAALTVCAIAIAVTAMPPAVSPDGGWRLADAAAAHIVDTVDAGWPPDEPRLLVGLPSFKPDDAMRFPLTRRGLALQPPVAATPTNGTVPVGVVIVVCDPLFDDVTGAACGSLAEDAWLSDAYPPSSMQLVERFRAGSRRVISVYAPSRLAAAPLAEPDPLAAP